MTVSAPNHVELTERERELIARIDFDPHEMRLHGRFEEVLEESCVAAKDLALSLLGRDAIPEIRRRYFTDPDLNVGSKRSRKEIFEGNGTGGDAILEHAHFLPYLKYFVYGPELPKQTIAGFCELVNDDVERDRLRIYAREEVRQRSLDRRDAAEEFYKLALECGLYESDARSVRDAALQTR